MIQPFEFGVTTAGAFDKNKRFRGFFIRVAKASGRVSINFDRGRILEFEEGGIHWQREPFSFIEVTSTAVEVVVLNMGSEVDDWEEAGPKVSGGLAIQGQYQNYLPGPVDPTTPRFLTVGMISYAGPGLGTSVPFSPPTTPGTTNGYETAVGFNDLAPASESYLQLEGGGLATLGFAGIKFTVTDVWTGTATLTDSTGNVIPFWDGQGHYFADGIVRLNGVYYAAVAGIRSFNIARGAGTGTLTINYTLSRVPASPVVITHPAAARRYLVYTGPLAAGVVTPLLAGINLQPGCKIRVFGYKVSTDAPTNMSFWATDGLGTTEVSCRGMGIQNMQEVDEPVFETASGQELGIFSSVAVAAGIQLRYEFVPA